MSDFPSSAELRDEMRRTIVIYREALEKIAEFGRKNSGYGYSCSAIALEALEAVNEIR